MMVRPEPPVPVVKAAQATATTIAIPPGIQPNSASKQRSEPRRRLPGREHEAGGGEERDGGDASATR